ncbi:hypothetical protein TL16_g11569 [Triparma laevis f. inornata]|uniref:Uncharacterized protein n=1 Tax=Triparma laevis f. inornata TaxID=1714386 RepID=A0A9W7BLG3_9STRA|nr:hypothetical protein TL16_g11569 [Triparma laevis f. inornata]
MLSRILIRSYASTSPALTPLLTSYISLPKLSDAGQQFETALLKKSKLQSIANNRHELFLETIKSQAAELQMIEEDPSLAPEFEKAKKFKDSVADRTHSLFSAYAAAQRSGDVKSLESINSDLQTLERELQLNRSPLESRIEDLKLSPKSEQFIASAVLTRYSEQTKNAIMENLTSSKSDLIEMATGGIKVEEFMKRNGTSGSITLELLKDLTFSSSPISKSEATSQIDTLINQAAEEYVMKPGLQTTEEEVEVYNRFVGEGGEQGRRVLKKLTGCTFEDGNVTVVDCDQLVAFAKDLESKPTFITALVSSHLKTDAVQDPEWTHIFSPAATLTYCAKLAHLSGLKCPKFFAEFGKNLTGIASHGNMRQVSMAADVVAGAGLKSTEFWKIINDNAKNIAASATSSEAALIADSLRRADVDCEELFKALIPYFDESRVNDMEDYFDKDYLNPSSYPDSTPTLPPNSKNTYSKLTRRIHYTTPTDIANFACAFAHFKYDSKGLFEKVKEFEEVWAVGEEKGRIGWALKTLKYEVEGTRFA